MSVRIVSVCCLPVVTYVLVSTVARSKNLNFYSDTLHTLGSKNNVTFAGTLKKII